MMADDGQLDERLARLDLAFEIFAHPAIPGEPAKRAFEDPASRPIGRFVSVMRSVLSVVLT
jgi:hypothetical protein